MFLIFCLIFFLFIFEKFLHSGNPKINKLFFLKTKFERFIFIFWF